MSELFDISTFQDADTAEMVVNHPRTGEPTTWKITFAGPGHPATVALADRIARKNAKDAREKEMARVNGRKWRGEDVPVEQRRRENAEHFAARMISWTPVRINGEDYPFTPENAVKLLLDPNYGRLFTQIVEFLADEDAFSKSSATA